MGTNIVSQLLIRADLREIWSGEFDRVVRARAVGASDARQRVDYGQIELAQRSLECDDAIGHQRLTGRQRFLWKCTIAFSK